MRISLHILTKDRNDSLAVLVSSLISQTHKEWDIVILDNGTQKARDNPIMKHLLNRLNFEGHRVYIADAPVEINDIGKLRNICIDSDPFKNEMGVRIDDDSWCEPDYLEIIVKGFTDDKIGIVGGIVPYMNYPKMYKLLPAKFNEVTKYMDWTDDCINFFNTPKEKYFEAGHVRSSYAYRVDIAKRVKFPEWTGPTGFTEETNFCMRVSALGYKILFNPNAVCWHMPTPHGGGRGTITSQGQMDEIKDTHIRRLKEEIDAFKKVVEVKI